MVLLEFAREYQMQGLRDRCAEVFNEVVAKMPNGDRRLLDLLVVASERNQLGMATIEQVHGKVDCEVLTAVYQLPKSSKRS